MANNTENFKLGYLLISSPMPNVFVGGLMVNDSRGLPLEFPVSSLGETLQRPTAMLYRNLASMDVEESIRGNPIDGVVLLMGCDKTTPSLLMGASSAGLPTIGVSGGPMLNGKWRGQELGSGTGVWSMSEQVRAGTLKLQDFFEAESCMHRSHGHCMTMGTASTMASMVEALGIGLPGNAAYPAVDGRRNVLAREAGRRIVEMVHTDQTISKVLTREAFENAIRTLAAIGGSTNAVIHLIAIAGRLGLKLTVDDFERLGSELPCLVNLQPSGEHLMEDFCYAGGLPVVMKEIQHLLHKDIVTVSGKTVGENIANADTPGYKAKDLEKVDFARLIRHQKKVGLPLSATNERHIERMPITQSYEVIKRPETYETTPSQNNVALEEEISKMAESQMEYQMITSLYRKSIDMFKTALGKNA